MITDLDIESLYKTKQHLNTESHSKSRIYNSNHGQIDQVPYKRERSQLEWTFSAIILIKKIQKK